MPSHHRMGLLVLALILGVLMNLSSVHAQGTPSSVAPNAQPAATDTRNFVENVRDEYNQAIASIAKITREISRTRIPDIAMLTVLLLLILAAVGLFVQIRALNMLSRQRLGAEHRRDLQRQLTDAVAGTAADLVVTAHLAGQSVFDLSVEGKFVLAAISQLRLGLLAVVTELDITATALGEMILLEAKKLSIGHLLAGSLLVPRRAESSTMTFTPTTHDRAPPPSADIASVTPESITPPPSIPVPPNTAANLVDQMALIRPSNAPVSDQSDSTGGRPLSLKDATSHDCGRREPRFDTPAARPRAAAKDTIETQAPSTPENADAPKRTGRSSKVVVASIPQPKRKATKPEPPPTPPIKADIIATDVQTPTTNIASLDEAKQCATTLITEFSKGVMAQRHPDDTQTKASSLSGGGLLFTLEDLRARLNEASPDAVPTIARDLHDTARKLWDMPNIRLGLMSATQNVRAAMEVMKSLAGNDPAPTDSGMGNNVIQGPRRSNAAR